MGFPFLHRYVFPDDVFSRTNPQTVFLHLKHIGRVGNVYFDCTGLLYRLSQTVETDNLTDQSSILTDKLENLIYYYIRILGMLPNNNFETSENATPAIHLVFDGRSPIEKAIVQDAREKRNRLNVENCIVNSKPLTGLNSILDKETRTNIIRSVSRSFEQRSHLFGGPLVVNTPSDEGEADIKIVKKLLTTPPPTGETDAIVTCDTDIFISLESLRVYSILVLISLPYSGEHFLFTDALNIWLDTNSLVYKNLLIYLLFFCGCDYETPLISGTKKQIEFIFEFAKKVNFNVAVDNLLVCWSRLNVRPSKMVNVVNLSLPILRTIAHLKLMSTHQSILYYTTGKPPKYSSLIADSCWRTMIRHILPGRIKHMIEESRAFHTETAREIE